MFDPFASALATLHRAAGSVAAVYFPKAGGPGVPIRVIRSQPDETVTFGRGRVIESTNVFQIQIVDVPNLAVGDRLTIGVDSFEIAGEPLRDVEGLAWTAGAELE
jgi:hypothetical protein